MVWPLFSSAGVRRRDTLPAARTAGARSNPRSFESASSFFAVSFVSRFGYFFFRSSRLPRVAVHARSHCSSRRAAHAFPPTTHRAVSRSRAARETMTTRRTFTVCRLSSGLRRPRGEDLVRFPDLEGREVRAVPGPDEIRDREGRSDAASHEGLLEDLS